MDIEKNGKLMQVIKKWKGYVRKLKAEIQVLSIVYQDKRTPLAAKILIWLTIGYLLSPIDLIPDFIPVLGLLDDLLIVPMLITVSLKLIPKAVLLDARKQAAQVSYQQKKKNWLFAAIIIVLWLFALYGTYCFLKVHHLIAVF